MATNATKETGLDFSTMNKYDLCLAYGHMSGRVEKFIKECDDKGFSEFVARRIIEGDGSFRAGLEILAKKYPKEQYYCKESGEYCKSASVWKQMLEFAVDYPYCDL